MLDFDLEMKNMRPINIKDMELSKYKISNNTTKSITLYNKSIAEIKANNLDLAIKDLKKALSYNKSFCEAIKLLGLCYVNNKEYRRAEKTFKKLGKYEIYTDLSMEYLKNLIIQRTADKTIEAIKRVNAGSDNKKIQFNLAKYLRRKIIIGFSVLTISVVGIFIIYSKPSKAQTVWKKAQAMNKIANPFEKINKNTEENKILSDPNTISYKEYESIQKKLENTNLELENYKNKYDVYKNKYDILTMLNQAEKSLMDGNYEKTANILIGMKKLNFDDETKVKFDKLWSEMKGKSLWNIYNQGNQLFKEAKYKEALPKLKIASEIDPNLDIMPWITYQIAICYEKINDNDNALMYLHKLKDNYPQSSYISSAERLINEIINNKE